MFDISSMISRGSISLVSFSRVSLSRILISAGLLAQAAIVAIAMTIAMSGAASAQDRRQNAAGEFDFYVLSLSWSPSFCAAAEERGNSGRSQAQCGERPFSFVVHGLWPQNDRGFPDDYK